MAALAALAILMTTPLTARELTLRLVETTDVHGNYFPYDFIGRREGAGSLSRVATFVDSLRRSAGSDRVVLLDNGDILQGQPSAYYFNYIDTTARHPAAEMYDYMGYDAATIGNHDIETGHAVFDRWIRQSRTPILGANVIDTSTGQPYLKPYTVIERDGIKIAVLGMLTEAIPAWLPENIWSGLRFEPVSESAPKWLEIIREKESPDLMVGLFHSGRDYSRTTDGMMENSALWVGENVPGFDIIFFGHDHQTYNSNAVNDGGLTLMMNPANNARNAALAEVTFTFDNDGKPHVSDKRGYIVDMDEYLPSPRFLQRFRKAYDDTRSFVDRVIGEAESAMSTRDAFFGPTTFMDLIHRLQLSISGADISLAAPLSFDATIHKGPMRVSDMFTLYKYENMLYTMRMTGREIKDYLEMSYSLWTRDAQPGQPYPHLLLFAADQPTAADNRLRHPAYNFDSAYGIDYTVDVTRPRGEKINITGMTDGRPFNPDSFYTVAVNSYRGNGGGNLMTEGAGISREELKKRIVKSTDHDLRYYLLREIERERTIRPRLTRNWKFIPEELTRTAARADSLLLFGEGASKEQK